MSHLLLTTTRGQFPQKLLSTTAGTIAAKKTANGPDKLTIFSHIETGHSKCGGLGWVYLTAATHHTHTPQCQTGQKRSLDILPRNQRCTPQCEPFTCGAKVMHQLSSDTCVHCFLTTDHNALFSQVDCCVSRTYFSMKLTGVQFRCVKNLFFQNHFLS